MIKIKSAQSKIGIIGFGKMGGAIFNALLKITNKKNIFLCDKNAGFGKAILKSQICKTSAELINKCAYIILAVKPQDFESLAEEIGKCKAGDKIYISIMAGVNIKKMVKLLGTKKVVRTMPNLPLMTGRGITGWYRAKNLTGPERIFSKKIICAWGKQFEVKKEKDLNAVTALSGSGPAYYFLIAEIMRKSAVDMGFSAGTADLIARETFIGAAGLLDSTGMEISQMRASITSKKGTTEAALNQFKKCKLESVIRKGINKAKSRAEELFK